MSPFEGVIFLSLAFCYTISINSLQGNCKDIMKIMSTTYATLPRWINFFCKLQSTDDVCLEYIF